MMLEKVRSRVLWVLMFVLAVTACAGNGPKFQEESVLPGNKVLIYVYRPSKIAGSALTPMVNINDDAKFRLANGGFSFYLSEPGEIKVTMTQNGTRTVTLNTNAGETYYLKGTTIAMAIPRLQLVSTEFALKEIRSCRLISEKK